MRTWRDAGITTLRVPAGNTLAERLETLGRAIDLVRGINEEAELIGATVAATGRGGEMVQL